MYVISFYQKLSFRLYLKRGKNTKEILSCRQCMVDCSLFVELKEASMNNQNDKKELPICLFYYRKYFIEFHAFRNNGRSKPTDLIINEQI